MLTVIAKSASTPAFSKCFPSLSSLYFSPPFIQSKVNTFSLLSVSPHLFKLGFFLFHSTLRVSYNPRVSFSTDAIMILQNERPERARTHTARNCREMSLLLRVILLADRGRCTTYLFIYCCIPNLPLIPHLRKRTLFLKFQLVFLESSQLPVRFRREVERSVCAFHVGISASVSLSLPRLHFDIK